MPDTFHPFLKLPRELREQIWTYAGDPSRRSVHVCPFYEDSPSDQPLQKRAINLMLLRHHSVRKRRLLHSRPTGNIQVRSEVCDKGMWSACRESRLVLQKPSRCPPETLFENGFTNYCRSFFPSSHLFYLIRPPTGPETFIEDYGEPDRGLSEVMVRSMPNTHLVVEYDQTWARKSNRTRIRSVLAYAARTLDVHVMWLVDYKIKRKQYAPSQQERTSPGIIFRCGNHQFVSVKDRQQEWDCFWHAEASGLWSLLNSMRWAERRVRMVDRPNCRWGVLACEEI
ncbi:hypothetical protein FHETE_1330 [Fusarium heterosporum]|uniref:2EXR domain-containing protein n=1 Tax=Fusarium heterosporum TaxID=42747 RepID=A0A8H5TW98_FUSHE|nr:hypothetical protein FHETE_1330 [Fusarium heterosporum]